MTKFNDEYVVDTSHRAMCAICFHKSISYSNKESAVEEIRQHLKDKHD